MVDEPVEGWEQRGLAASFRAAGWGLLTTLSTQRNMKIHHISAVMVMIVGMALPLDFASRAALLFCVALVFFAEILNTALEAFVDLHMRDYARLALMAKDATAAGVLVLSIATVVILVDILYYSWAIVVAEVGAVQRSVTFGVPLTVVIGATLWTPPRALIRLPLAAVGIGLAIPLWRHSADVVFSLLLGLLMLLAFVARSRLPTTKS